MKTLKMLVLVVAITFSSVVSANTNPIKNAEPSSISQTVAELLKKPSFEVKENVDTLAYIYVNEQDEMVVLSVDTDNRVVEDYIKSRLNYKKLSKNVLNHGKMYKLPIKIQKSN